MEHKTPDSTAQPAITPRALQKRSKPSHTEPEASERDNSGATTLDAKTVEENAQIARVREMASRREQLEAQELLIRESVAISP